MKYSDMKYIKNLTVILIILTISIFITACDTTRRNIFAPNKRIFKQLPKGAEGAFKQGYLEGCETGLSTGFGSDYYKTFYRFRKDVKMVKTGNKAYTRAWGASMIFCRHYALASLKQAGMTPVIPGHEKSFRLIPIDITQGVFKHVMSPEISQSILSNW